MIPSMKKTRLMRYIKICIQLERQETNFRYATIGELLDKVEEQGDGTGSQGGTNTDGKKGPLKISKEERDQLKDEIKNAVIQVTQVAGAGNVPAGVERMIK